MNLALLQGSGDVVATGLYFVTFNQDATSLAVGTTTGYKLFTLNGHDRFDQTYEFTGKSSLKLILFLFRSSVCRYPKFLKKYHLCFSFMLFMRNIYCDMALCITHRLFMTVHNKIFTAISRFDNSHWCSLHTITIV